MWTLPEDDKDLAVKYVVFHTVDPLLSEMEIVDGHQREA